MARHPDQKYLMLSFLSVSIAASLLGCKFDCQPSNSEDSMIFYKNDISLTFELGDESIINPFMGFSPDAYSDQDVEKCTLAYLDVTFKELEPEEGVFDFENIEKDNNLDKWRAQGKHIVFRFICDKPSHEAHFDIPDWLYDKIGGDGKVYDISYGKGFSPNYANEIFIEYHAKAIEELGKHFGQDSFFSYIELGSLGHWGEWHVNYEAGIPRIPSEDIREQYIKPYIQVFSFSKILMRRPFKAANSNGFGLFNDMAGDPESTEAWLDWIENGGDYSQANEKNALVPMEAAWKTAPIGGEFTSSLAMDWMLKTNIAETASLLAKSHTTFLGPKIADLKGNSFNDDILYRQGIDSVIKSMGYRLGIIKADISKPKSDGTAMIELTWINKGVAPLYFDLPVKLYVLDQNNNTVSTAEINVNLSKLLTDDKIKTKTVFSFGGLESGYKICVGIIDPLTNKPAVKLINKAEIIKSMMLIYEKH